MKGNRKYLAIILPIVAVIPLLIITYLIGPSAIWLWAGIGIGMVVFSVVKTGKEATK